MLQDGDDHNHDPTVNWRLEAEYQYWASWSHLGTWWLFFSWTWWSWWWWWWWSWWWWLWTTALSEFYIFKCLNVQRTSAVAAEGREWWMEERRWLMCVHCCNVFCIALEVCIVAVVSRVMWCVQCNVCICAFAMTTSVKYCIITNSSICCALWRILKMVRCVFYNIATSCRFQQILFFFANRKTFHHWKNANRWSVSIALSLSCAIWSVYQCAVPWTGVASGQFTRVLRETSVFDHGCLYFHTESNLLDSVYGCSLHTTGD